MRRQPDRLLTFLLVLMLGPMWAVPAGAGMCFSSRGADAAAACCGEGEGEGAWCECCESTPTPAGGDRGERHDCRCCIDVPIPDLPRHPKLTVEAGRVLEIVLAEEPVLKEPSATGLDRFGMRWALPPPDRPDCAMELALKSVRLLI